MKSSRSLPVIAFISILLASPWFFTTSVYAANSQCSSSFTDGLQIHSAGGVLSFAHEATLKNSPSNILTTPTIVVTGGDPTCGNVNCTATGTSSIQMNPGPYETQTGGLNLFIRKKKRATIGAAGIVNYNRIAVGTKARLKTTASETTYWISSLTTQKKTVLNLTPGTYWIDSLHLGQKTKLNIIGAGTVRIISRNTMVFDKDVKLNVKGAANQNLILYSYGNITVQKKTKIKALLYAQGTIIINKEAKITGALSATNIILKSNNKRYVIFSENEE